MPARVMGHGRRESAARQRGSSKQSRVQDNSCASVAATIEPSKASLRAGRGGSACEDGDRRSTERGRNGKTHRATGHPTVQPLVQGVWPAVASHSRSWLRHGRTTAGQAANSASRSWARSESVFDARGRPPEGAVPGPSPGRHAAARSRRASSSSIPPAADGFGAGTPEPNPQSQSFSRSYGSVLPTSLAYIVPLARGCSPWRPDAVMSTTGRGRNSVLRIFKGRRGRTGHRAMCGALRPLDPTSG
uniref:Uncharacterized protein n=1 Tax=Zea mays TaxID=4577 RepID=A0A804UNM2_MAIZE